MIQKDKEHRDDTKHLHRDGKFSKQIQNNYNKKKNETSQWGRKTTTEMHRGTNNHKVTQSNGKMHKGSKTRCEKTAEIQKRPKRSVK